LESGISMVLERAVVLLAVVDGENGEVGPEVRRRRCAIVGERTLLNPVALVVLSVGMGAGLSLPVARMALMLPVPASAPALVDAAATPPIACEPPSFLPGVAGLHNLYRSANLAATGVMMRGEEIVSLGFAGRSCAVPDCFFSLLLLAMPRLLVLPALPVAIAGNANASARLVDL